MNKICRAGRIFTFEWYTNVQYNSKTLLYHISRHTPQNALFYSKYLPLCCWLIWLWWVWTNYTIYRYTNKRSSHRVSRIRHVWAISIACVRWNPLTAPDINTAPGCHWRLVRIEQTNGQLHIRNGYWTWSGIYKYTQWIRNFAFCSQLCAVCAVKCCWPMTQVAVIHTFANAAKSFTIRP